MSAKKTTGSRFQLGEPVTGMLSDFSAAMLGAPETEIIRAAVRDFIERELERSPGIRDRYEKARAERFADAGKVANLKPVGG